MGRVKPATEPMRQVLTPIVSTVTLLVMTGWIGLAHKPEASDSSGVLIVPAIRQAIRMIENVPTALHQSFLNALGTTLLTLMLAAGSAVIFMVKRKTQITIAKAQTLTLLACLSIIAMQLMLYARESDAGLQALLMASLGLLCHSNQSPRLRFTTAFAAVVGWITWAGTSALA